MEARRNDAARAQWRRAVTRALHIDRRRVSCAIVLATQCRTRVAAKGQPKKTVYNGLVLVPALILNLLRQRPTSMRLPCNYRIHLISNCGPDGNMLMTKWYIFPRRVHGETARLSQEPGLTVAQRALPCRR